MYHFIINKTAASGKGARIWKNMEALLKDQNVRYKAHFPKSEQAVLELVGKLTAPTGKIRHLVILGGDGTLNLVLQAIDSFEETRISLIPIGSANDFARSMGISRDALDALDHLLNDPKEKILDFGETVYIPSGETKARLRRFAISCGLGYDADICYEAGKSRLKKIMNRIHLGKLVYLFIGIKQNFTRKNSKVVIKIDDKDPITLQSLFFAVGMIHPYEGGGVPFCPKADPQDEKLDVCIVNKISKIKFLLGAVLVYFRKLSSFKEVSVRRCSRIIISAAQPQWFHLDGETPCKVRKVALTCRHGLRLVK